MNILYVSSISYSGINAAHTQIVIIIFHRVGQSHICTFLHFYIVQLCDRTFLSLFSKVRLWDLTFFTLFKIATYRTVALSKRVHVRKWAKKNPKFQIAFFSPFKKSDRIFSKCAVAQPWFFNWVLVTSKTIQPFPFCIDTNLSMIYTVFGSSSTFYISVYWFSFPPTYIGSYFLKKLDL